MKSIVVSFISPPGAGKTTQLKHLEGKDFKTLVTSEYLKDLPQCNEGDLVDDNEVIRRLTPVLPRYLGDNQRVAIDGCPRTLKQLHFMNGFVTAMSRDYICMYLDISLEQVFSRLLQSNRGRPDDAPEIIQKRFAKYQEQTKPMIQWLKGSRNSYIKFLQVNAALPPDQVFDQVWQGIQSFNLVCK